MSRLSLPILLLALLALLAQPAEAQYVSPDNRPAADNSPEAQLASFAVHEDLEISLWADESLGIANPVAIQWDPLGRLWVLCTLAYAQLQPGERSDDHLYVLEDTNGDGRADTSTLFADGLTMPMGFALGHGGVWLAEGEELLHLADTNGDGRADQRRLVLTGFGTGDTHQNISNLVFDSGGYLYFAQGLHAFSQVETPWGVARGDSAGFWRFDPRLTRLDPFGFPSMTSQNPCGIALDRWGALFLKSNGPHLGFATPGLIPTTHPRELMVHSQVGQTPGKSMGGAIVESAHLPDWLQGQAVIAGYFARDVSSLPLVEEGSGFAVSRSVRLVFGGHESFRPVDIQQGPDGAIYVADWFNPVINHYQVSLRHPDRDYSHGRIWRLAAKGRAPAERPALEAMAPDELFEQLRSGERWTRDQARRLLMDHPESGPVAEALAEWAAALDPADADESHALVEAVGVMEALGIVDEALLNRLQSSVEPRARAVVARIVARFPEPLPGAEERLAALLRDPHPRPRLEAVVACANRPAPGSLPLALLALDAPVDKHLDYALRQTVQALAAQWLPAAEAGELTFADPGHLAFALEAYGGERAAGLARAALAEASAGGETQSATERRLLGVLARVGTAEDARAVLETEHPDPGLLESLVHAWEARRLRPAAPFVPRLAELASAGPPEVRALALRLAGLWQAADLAAVAEATALDSEAPDPLRAAALVAHGRLGGAAAAEGLGTLALDRGIPGALRLAAMEGLVAAEPAAAARTALGLSPEELAEGRLAPLFALGTGPAALAEAIEAEPDRLEPRAAQEMLNALTVSGRSDPKLSFLLNRALGVQDGAPEYDGERVAALVEAVRSGGGDAEKGQTIYQRAELACVACHQVGGVGGILGPELDAVGAGLPLDQIVEAILWPARQIKEGYHATSITIAEGRVYTGYIDREDERVVWLRDTATGLSQPVARDQIVSREIIGSLMPAGLTASLDDEELRDLVAYLASLKG